MKTQQFIKTLIGYDKIKVIDFIEEQDPYDGEAIFVARVELHKNEQYKCPVCGVKCRKYGWQSSRFKRWRSLDLSKKRFYIECEVPRCRCPEHGVKVQKIPWAFPNSDYTYAFDMQVAYCAAMSPTNLVAQQYRIKWDTVGSCVRRVQENVPLFWPNNFKNLHKIAIDEVSYKKGHKYLTVVLNLENDEIIWASPGYGKEVLTVFFNLLSDEQRGNIEYVVADGARWITACVEEFCPNAVRCMDPFHVVQWANESLDNVRKRIASDTKKNDLRS